MLRRDVLKTILAALLAPNIPAKAAARPKFHPLMLRSLQRASPMRYMSAFEAPCNPFTTNFGIVKDVYYGQYLHFAKIAGKTRTSTCSDADS